MLIQALTGLASACSLFLAASGLSLIFGVTRIVNFAHGAFVMLGAYFAWTLTERWTSPLGFWAGLLAAALATAACGALFEILVLRRLYRAPELFQLLATFAATLILEDLVRLVWGPEDLLTRRAPGLAGAVVLLGKRVPQYDLFLLAAAPLVLLALTLLLRRTRWGLLVRAATADRDMAAALGVDQRTLFTAVFALGTFLAGLAGALAAPRDAVSHAMDLRILVAAFVTVVIGGLGSIPGAFLAAALVSLLDAFAVLVAPKLSLVLAFLVMGAVLALRPRGLLGRPDTAPRAPAAPAQGAPWRPWSPHARAAAALATAAVAGLVLLAGPYAQAVASETAIAVLFAASVHLLLSAGGLVPFGQAAFFGLGAYGAALAVKLAGLPMVPALACGVALASAGAAAAGFAVARSGIYFAMLTLAFAQVLWSVAEQWNGLTGGDNGLLGVWPDPWAASPAAFAALALAATALTVAALRGALFAPFGTALRAVRDSPARAAAAGIDPAAIQHRAVILAGAAAGLAGALFAFLKGSVFPDSLAIPLSVDGLAMVLVGGVATVSGPVVGGVAYKLLAIWLASRTDYSKLVLGTLILALVLARPQGILRR